MCWGRPTQDEASTQARQSTLRHWNTTRVAVMLAAVVLMTQLPRASRLVAAKVRVGPTALEVMAAATTTVYTAGKLTVVMLDGLILKVGRRIGIGTHIQ